MSKQWYVVTRCPREAEILHRETINSFRDIIDGIPLIEGNRKIVAYGHPLTVNVCYKGDDSNILQITSGIQSDIDYYKGMYGDDGEEYTITSDGYDIRNFAMCRIAEILRIEKESDKLKLTVLCLPDNYHTARNYIRCIHNTLMYESVNDTYNESESKITLSVSDYVSIKVLWSGELLGFLGKDNDDHEIITVPKFCSKFRKLSSLALDLCKKYKTLDE